MGLGVITGPGNGAVATTEVGALAAVPLEDGVRSSPAGGATPTIVCMMGERGARAGVAAPIDVDAAARVGGSDAGAVLPLWAMGAGGGCAADAGASALGAGEAWGSGCGLSGAATEGSSSSQDALKRSASRSASSGETSPSSRAVGSVTCAPVERRPITVLVAQQRALSRLEFGYGLSRVVGACCAWPVGLANIDARPRVSHRAANYDRSSPVIRSIDSRSIVTSPLGTKSLAPASIAARFRSSCPE